MIRIPITLDSRGARANNAPIGTAAKIARIGVIAIAGIAREVFPNVAFDRVSIATAYPGATPQDVEKLIIDDIVRCK